MNTTKKGDTTMLDNLFNVTKAVNVQIAKDAEFYKFVANCFFRFNDKDWGDVQSDSIELNNADPKSALGIYNNLKGKKVWIQSVEYENYTVQTAMFPSDY